MLRDQSLCWSGGLLSPQLMPSRCVSRWGEGRWELKVGAQVGAGQRKTETQDGAPRQKVRGLGTESPPNLHILVVVL